MDVGKDDRKGGLRAPSTDEARERGRAGGKASGRARAERKSFAKTLNLLLSMPLDPKRTADIECIRSYSGIDGKNITVQEAILIAQVTKAMTGDRGSAEFIRDTVGEKPTEVTRLEGGVAFSFEGMDEDFSG